MTAVKDWLGRTALSSVRPQRPTAGAVDESSKIQIIEALRGVAAIWVALFHFAGLLSTNIPHLVGSMGWLGVDIFFVISGFIIPYSLFGRSYSISDFPRFMLRRLIRLEPPYLLSILLGIALWHAASIVPGFLGNNPNYSLAQVCFHLFYIIPFTHYDWLSPVYWTLAYEFVFYILVGLLYPVLINRHVVWTVGVGALIVIVLFLGRSELDVRVLEFLLGAIAMRFVCQKHETPSTMAWLTGILAAVFAAGGLAIGIACLITAFSFLFLRRQVLGRWALAIGSISYSLYLTHGLIGGRVINLGKRFGGDTTYEAVLFMLALATSVLFAVVFLRVIEAPAIAASRTIRLHKFLDEGN